MSTSIRYCFECGRIFSIYHEGENLLKDKESSGDRDQCKSDVEIKFIPKGKKYVPESESIINPKDATVIFRPKYEYIIKQRNKKWF